jgi:hypothetical protein
VAFTAVFVDFTNPRKPFEIHRDARDPQGSAQAELEQHTRIYSLGGRTVRLYVVGQYVKPWRQRKGEIDAEYEARDGQPTDPYRSI